MVSLGFRRLTLTTGSFYLLVPACSNLMDPSLKVMDIRFVQSSLTPQTFCGLLTGWIRELNYSRNVSLYMQGLSPPAKCKTYRAFNGPSVNHKRKGETNHLTNTSVRFQQVPSVFLITLMCSRCGFTYTWTHHGKMDDLRKTTPLGGVM